MTYYIILAGTKEFVNSIKECLRDRYCSTGLIEVDDPLYCQIIYNRTSIGKKMNKYFKKQLKAKSP
jgi:hypothetical protein